MIRGRVLGDSARGIVATVMVTSAPHPCVPSKPPPIAPETTACASTREPATTSSTSAPPDSIRLGGASKAREWRARARRRFHPPRADIATLDAVKVTGQKPVRAKNPVGPMQPEPGSPEKWKDGIAANPAHRRRRPQRHRRTMSNVTMTPGGPSISAPDPNPISKP